MATTPKGYPYPIGTDRVMDGDDAIRALAEALDADATQYTRALPAGNSVPSTLATPVTWNAPTVNGCALTKTDASTWTVTRAGLYVITAQVALSAFAAVSARAFVAIYAGPNTNNRQVMSGENAGVTTVMGALAVGDTIAVNVFVSAAMSVTTSSGYFHCARLGRS